MKTRTVLSLGLSTVVLAGTSIGLLSQHGPSAFASARSESRAERDASREAGLARHALGVGDPLAAIAHAETAVGLRPQVASFRALLGQAYLKAGRFASARTAFADSASLDPADGKVALDLALTQIATGDWDAARQTLTANNGLIAISDRGLALALAGDPVGAVAMLDAPAHAANADTKIRQNLALSLALAGRWQDARKLVAVDLAPDEVDARMQQWATFAHPAAADDQVAAMLGVTPSADPGLPAQLALQGAAPQVADALTTTRVTAATPVVAAPLPAASAVATTPDAGSAGFPVAVAALSGVTFAPPHEVVQPLEGHAVTAALAVAPTVSRAMTVVRHDPNRSMHAATAGTWFVQIGAYDNAGVAKDAWTRVSRRFARFGGQQPQGMSITVAAGSFYRLSLGGFARADAATLCHQYKATGGACFIRPGAGDQIARWARSDRQLASR